MATKIETEDFALYRRDGVPASATLRCRVVGVTGSEWHDKLEDATSALPDYGHEIFIEGYSLFLETVSIQKSESTPIDVHIADLTYNQYYRVGIQGGNAIPRGSTFSRSYLSSVDKDNAPVIVAHTWPTDDMTIGIDGEPRGGKTDTQNAQFNLFDSPRTLFVDVVYEGDAPGGFAANYSNRVNSTTWQGGEPGQWKCINVDWRYLKVQTPGRLSIMTFEFEFAPDPGHQRRSTARFIDPATGLPPEGLEADVGTILVDTVDVANFGDII